MKRFLILSLMLALTACAHDNYTVLPDGNGSQANMSKDLHDCKMESIHAYYASQPPMSGLQVAGLVAGGAIGGAIGGAAFGAAESTADNGTMKKSDIDPYIERCMLSKGYSGTSN